VFDDEDFESADDELEMKNSELEIIKK